MVRLKHRYFVLELAPPGEKAHARLVVNEDAIYRAVLEVVDQIHGDYGVATVRSRLIVKYCNAVTRVALLRVSHAAHRLLASALPFMTSLEGQPITPRTLYMGATIMHCFRFLKRHQESHLEEMWASADPHRRHQMREAIMALKLPNIAETRGLPGV
ncbi:Ribonuclease P/MRP protein subunit POP5 [Amphibalanus amphitrite]|uniref:Ribonuclease P/MRP protein subunit POP5 n=1 Tax=Amphibalanus amphitrite TaxID=1232801 RepID=A0A6A4WS72_AMPAM|nr:ribonuclease P/MRP protein subunit POP5-like [Amphibalanus amphitrite]XP_043224470.1 ribonuclease P/MRP protein subunit POP5-like [Amphibalanus amphitrite]XP_043224471.1 ribonuclease P/MRP protein subunit POP5-like [Amphibalanus amphitrite]XP_043224472.1 ribonuclease P/MRP protein subunit POP5-like [Amphibalanus amphitrite]KAF0308903.1 Ribonuclease P/MRP protein subunit POP5 [Amphibalanus amphitrite]